MDLTPLGWCVTLDSNQQTIACTLDDICYYADAFTTNIPQNVLFASNTYELAEGVGFELTELFTLAGSQDRYLKPLGHPST